MSLTFSVLAMLIVTPSITSSQLRYTEQSCMDLTPRPQEDFGLTSRVERDNAYALPTDEIPFRMSAKGRRYRRDADVVVQIEGGAFDGLMLQARSLGGSQSRSASHGGITVVGEFRYLRFAFKYLSCFDSPASTVIHDEGQAVKLGNQSFVWRAPDHDAGDVRFVASILRGSQYWVIVSNTLNFNPFPISSYSCGSTLACFRVCPYDQSTCLPRDAIFVFTYHVNVETLQIEFTLGGRLLQNNSYIAVAFGDDYDNLRQAEMMACWIDRGKARVEHLLIENLHLPPYVHVEQNIVVDDYDLHLDDTGYDKLWCRFRRTINTAVNDHFDITKPMYHFHFWGNVDKYFYRFVLPRMRNQIYSSADKRNFSHSLNEIVSRGRRVKGVRHWSLLLAAAILTVTSYLA